MSAYITKKQYYQGSSGSGTLLKTAQTDYQTTPAVLPIHETTTWNQQNVVSRTETNYDSYPSWSYSGVTNNTSAGNPTEKREYAFGSGTWGSLVRTTDLSYLHLTNSTYRGLNILDKLTSKKVYAGSSQTGTLMAQTSNTYDGVAISGNTSANPAPNHDYTQFPASYNLRGNLTQASVGLKSTSGTWSWLNTNFTYNDLGEVLTTSDPLGHVTTNDYTDNWATISNPQCTPSGKQTYAFPTTVTDPLGHRTKHTYYSCTSLLGSTQDENDIAASRAGTTYSYDLMSRISGTNFPDGGVTASAYSDSVPYSKTTTELIRTSPSVLHKVSTTLYDGIGRVQQTQLVDPDCGGGTGLVKVDRVYGYNIGAGRYEQTSTPYCNSPGSPYGLLETTNYDALDRATSVLQTDGSSVTTSYSATSAGLLSTVTDEAAKQRKNQTDALGRLTAVWEDPAGLNFETDYSYDALDNLLNVTQKGGTTVTTQWRVRTFTYDSLSRLLSAANPESGTITYSYDNDGNLLSKVAPQPNQTGSATVTTNYTYDAVNRMTKKAYVGMSTAGAQYGYDGLAPAGCTTAPPVLTDSNAIGSRTAMCDASGATSWKHDSMGRVLTESRIVIGTSPWTKSAGYTYNFDGSIATISDPGVGRVMTYTPTAAGRQKSVVNTGGSINFVTNATYAPQGALATYTSGGVVNTTNSYNSRLQPLTLSAATTGGTSILKLTYDFHATTQANNGNVYQIANGRDNNRTQNFLYDSLNRIQQAYTSGTNWGETFGPAATAPGVPPSTSGIDAWGNLTNRSGVAGKTAYEGLTATATTQNRLSGFSYDVAGNMTANGSAIYTYDAENRVIGTAGWTYVYDGDGRRVKKFSGSTGTLYWPDLGGNTLNESSLGATNLHEYVYFGGKRVARIDVPTPLTVKYYFSDQLGSADVITDATGNILEESDYFPYGGEIAITNNDGNNYKFTGKERDTESGLDEFGARYYASSLGRFMIPDWAEKPTDVPYASFGNPQSLNLYSYVNNNPTTTRDPDGHVAGADDLVEGAVIGLTITVMATQAYYAMPAQQRNFGAALSGAASSVSSTIRSWFQSSDNSKTAPAPQSNPAPGTQTGSQPGQKDADFVVTPSGTAVATDPGRVRDSLVNAPGVTTTPANSPSGETGTIQTGVKTPNGPVDVRTMDGSASHGPRTVITHPGTNSPKTPDGKATNNKNDNHIPNDHVRPH